MKRFLPLLLLLLCVPLSGQTTVAPGVVISPGATIPATAATPTYPVTPPGDATAYTSIEQESGWVEDAGSDVSPNPPTAYAIVPTGGGGSTMVLQTSNTADVYAGWMAKKTITTTGQQNMVLDATYEFDSVSGIQAWEVGRRSTNAAGITDNGQTQLVPKSGTYLEFDLVATPGGGWTDSTCHFPIIFAIGTTYTEEIYYVNDSNGALSIEYVELNGDLCTIPSDLQHVAGQSLGYTADRAIMAYQPDIKPNGATYNATVTLTAYAW